MKTYIKPRIKAKNVLSQTMMAGSNDVKLGFGQGGSADEADANSRRGSWGNLWNSEDQD